METPPIIDFHGIEPDQAIRERVLKHVDQLEARFGRITSCRIAITGPGDHHQKGGLFQVNIQLLIPNGKEIAVGRVNHGDERRADLHFAVDNAFKRARRQLQDRVRRLQGAVKHHEPTATGTVSRIDPSGDHGFIQTAEGDEIYFHRNSVLNAAFSHLRPGAQVSFVEEAGEKGPQASTVTVLRSHSLK